MGKNNKNPKPAGFCKRIFRAFKGQAKHRPKTVELEPQSSPQADLANNNVNITKPASNVVVPPKARTVHVGSGEGQAAKHDDDANDDKFSDFIDRAKMKIRAVSNIGAAKRPARTDSINDKALDYINRAKVRIRTTSLNLGTGIKSLASSSK